MKVFFKDKFVNEKDALVSINDRSFRFGDGVFETCLVVNGKIFDFAAHKKRFDEGLEFLQIKLETKSLKKISEELIKKNSLKNGYIRIIASRGENGPDAVGYFIGAHKPYLVVQSFHKPYPEYKKIKLFVSNIRLTNRTPAKMNSSIHYVMALTEAKKNKCDNALVLDSDENICETGSGNIFWVRGETLYTPSLSLPFVPGTVRKKVIEVWPGKVVEGKFKLKEIFSADEVFMSNIGSIISSVNVIKPGTHKFNSDKKTKEIRKILDKKILNS